MSSIQHRTDRSCNEDPLYPPVRVLIVEDEAIVAEDLRLTVASLGYQVAATATNGEEAVTCAKNVCPDVVLLDIQLVGMLDGIETATQIREICNPAIIFITAHSDPETVKSVKEMGDCGYVLKPFGERDLAIQLDIALYKNRTAKALHEKEERWQLAVTGSTDGIWDWNIPQRTVFLSSRWKAFRGYSEEEIGTDETEWSSRIHPDDYERVLATVRSYLEKKTSEFQCEYRTRCKDGSYRYILDRGIAVWDSQGRPIRMVGSETDITDRKRAEDALQFIALFPAQNPSPVLRVDAAGILLYMNPSSGRLLGDLRLETGNAVPPDLQALIQQSVQSGRSVQVEREISSCHYVITVTPLVKENYANLYWTDITERKRAEIALRESERRFRDMADAAPVLIWISDTSKLCTWFNRTWLDFTGRTMEQELGNGWADAVHLDDLNPCLNMYTSSFDQRKPFTMEYRLRRYDGQYRWIVDHGIPRYAETGEFLGYIGSCVDVHERRKTEETLRMRSNQLQLLYELANAVNRADALSSLYETALDAIVCSLGANRGSILTIDESGNMRFQAWRGLSQSYRTAVEGHSPWKSGQMDYAPITVPNVSASDIEPTLRATILEEGIQALAFIPLTFRGRLIGKFMVYFDQPHAMSNEEVELAQGIANTLAIGIDRKWTEEALRESEVRLKHFAEELERRVTTRTAELLQSQERLRAMATELNLAEQRERKRLAAELHDHLQQLLVLGKLTLGQGKRETTSYPAAARTMKKVDALLSEALTYTRTLVAELSPPVLRDHGLVAGLKWLAEYMTKHGITVSVRASDVSDVTLPDDQVVLLFQSVRELLINASKHAGIEDASVTMEQHAGILHLTVSDKGSGFDLAAADASSEEASSKFGLFSIKERMRALGGSFEARSAPGEGTTVTLTLPLTTVAPAKKLRLPSARVTEHTMHHSKADPLPIRVLLVDDHAMVRQGLKSLLENYPDVQVIGEAGNGEEAVLLAGQLRPSIVVMDVHMPRMNGIEAAAVIKELHPEMPIIGLSVNCDANTQKAMKDAGALVIITKEEAVEQLYNQIRETIDGRLPHEQSALDLFDSVSPQPEPQSTGPGPSP